MRYRNHGILAMVGSVLLLSACTDGATAPLARPLATVGATSLSSCTAAQRATAQSLGTPPTLATVTVTATMPGISFGLPFDLVQSMNFAGNFGMVHIGCLEMPEAHYSIIETDTVPDEPGKPDDVDENFWGTLSNREKHALIKLALEYMQMFPDRYPTTGTVINEVFRSAMLYAKAHSLIRAADFFAPGASKYLFAGGIYGCMLYQKFSNDQYWFLSRAETLQMVSSLVAAFGEAQYATQPAMALLFGRNGAFGAGAASAAGPSTDCGTVVFGAISSGRITVTDPYGGGATPNPRPDLPDGPGLDDWDR